MSTTATTDNRELWKLVLVIAAAVVLAGITGALPTVGVVAAIVAMVMLHELGHLIVAKASGMKVTEYFFGFGPKLWSVRRGETEYGIKPLLVGGYVKIPGMSNLEEVDPADEPRTYRQQSFPRRLAVVVAGSAMHFLIAFVLLMVLWCVVGVPNYSRPKTVIGSISRIENGPSPAQAGGLRVGDLVLAVDGHPEKRWQAVRDYIQPRAGKPITFTVERAGQRLDLVVVPVEHANEDGQKVGFIGVGPKVSKQRLNPVSGAARSARLFADSVAITVKGLASFFSPGRLQSYGRRLFSNARPSASGPAQPGFLSPVDLVRVSGQAAESGAFAVLFFLIELNIGVGVFNMIPLLPLDGGQAAIAIYERLRSRKGRRYHADIRKLMPLTAAVVGVLAVIIVSSLWLSITQPMPNPFQ